MRYADTGSLIQAGTTSNTRRCRLCRSPQSDLLRLRMPVPEADVPYIQRRWRGGGAGQATRQTLYREDYSVYSGAGPMYADHADRS